MGQSKCQCGGVSFPPAEGDTARGRSLLRRWGAPAGQGRQSKYVLCTTQGSGGAEFLEVFSKPMQEPHSALGMNYLHETFRQLDYG